MPETSVSIMFGYVLCCCLKDNPFYLEWSCFSKSVYLSKTNQNTKLATPINALEI
jgi:hypothetical protein